MTGVVGEMVVDCCFPLPKIPKARKVNCQRESRGDLTRLLGQYGRVSRCHGRMSRSREVLYCLWRMGRVIAGPPSLCGCRLRLQPASRRPTGRKVRTPSLRRITPQTKGNAPGNAKGLSLPCCSRERGGSIWLRTVQQKINRRCHAPRWSSEGKPSEGLKAARASGLRKVECAW
jgi:hypothetical protein